ncbi:efflux RND transporter permease subunit, partial [Pseudomonas syringae]|uniref:efflux RND transporter permease subunit n=1 Tax=Pseudomonas syringae TaxID=317 RepID=UPI0034D953AD
AYARLLTHLLKGPKLVFSLGFAIVFIMIGLGVKLGTEVIPELDEGSIFLRSFMPSGVTIQENAKIAPKIRQIIAKNF